MDEHETSTMFDHGGWRFNFDSGHTLEAENMSQPFERIKVPCPSQMRHSDLEMFARGWVACKLYG